MLSMLLGNREPQATKSPTDPFWYHSMVPMSSSGNVVTPEGAMNVSAVYACVRILAEAVSTLPLKLYRRRPDGGKEVAQNHYMYSVLHDAPNPFQTSVEFFEFAMYCLCLRGNFFCDVIDDGEILSPIHPDNFKGVRKTAAMDLVYEFAREKGVREEVHSDYILHVKGLSGDGMQGMAPVTLLRNVIGLALSAESFGASLFKNGVRPSGVLEHPNVLTDTALSKIRNSFAEHVGSGNNSKPLVLDEGMKWHQISMTNEDAQFLDTRKLQIEEIARAYRVPLHMLQMMDRATFSNIEHMGIEFVVHSLRPWVVRFEKAIKRSLLKQDVLFAEFLVDGLLRGDTKSRYEAYGMLIDRTVLSPNEVRMMENMNPRDGGDVYQNPNTTKFGTENTQQPPQPQNQEQAVSTAFAKDIAGRLAARELKEVQKHAKHQKRDPEGFREWAKTFYQKQAEYADSALSTFCDVHHIRDMDRIAAIETLTARQCERLIQSDAAQTVEIWEKTLYDIHSQTLMELVA